MGIFDKLSNLIFENDSGNNSEIDSSKPKKNRLSDIFFTTEEDVLQSGKRSLSSIFFEDNNTPRKPRRKLSDILFEDTEEDIHSSFIGGEEKEQVLQDLPSKIQYRESELTKIGEILKTVDVKEYPDSEVEMRYYISLIDRLGKIKEYLNSSEDSLSRMRGYELEAEYKKLESEYQNHINAIKSLCYVSEIKIVNEQMRKLFSEKFTEKTSEDIGSLERYITLISKKIEIIDKKYTDRLYKGLIEAEYRLTLLKLMKELHMQRAPRKNPFTEFSSQKRKIFETFLSRDIQETSIKYNTISNSEEKYTKNNLVGESIFRQMDKMASVITEKINQYSIDNFLVNELLDDGDGYETLKLFLAFKLILNSVDSYTQAANQGFLDEYYKRAMEKNTSASGKKPSGGPNVGGGRFDWD